MTKYSVITSLIQLKNKNPEVNFVKLEGTSGNNNLKDRYFSLINNKDINSKIKHSFYNPINRENIERAFSEAGQLNSLPDIG